ncbi:hypothetical protein IW262DRAFT_1296856 [Armillaria fumosa]|nr:hypothetical protein IW262DRAFT_1296856 [Armillaria fumosa]
MEVHSVDNLEPSKGAKIVVVGRVMANPHLIKLRDVGNFNDRFMRMHDAKWVIHLLKPMGTLFERDWDVGMSNLSALEQRVATLKGVNMLMYHKEDGSVNLHMTAPCFFTNTVEACIAQEKSMAGSLVEVTFIIKHYFINTSNTDSFSAIILSAQIMVSGLCYEEAMEAYEAYMATQPLAGGLSQNTEKDVEEEPTVMLTYGLEDTISSNGTEKVMDSEEDIEEDNSRKCKGRGGGGTECTVKKVKLNGLLSCTMKTLFIL